MMSALERDPLAFAFGEEEFSDIELVFVQEHQQQQQQRAETKSDRAAKRLRKGRSKSNVKLSPLQYC